MTEGPAGKAGQAGRWGSVLGPASAPNGGDRGSEARQAVRGGLARPGSAARPRFQDSSHPAPSGREGSRPPPQSGAGALTHRQGGEEQPASPPARSLEFRHRLLPLRPPRPVHPPQPTPLPTLPPRRLSRSAAAAAAAAATAASVPAREREAARVGESACARRRRPQPPPPAARRTREAAAGARTQQGAGTASPAPRGPAPRPRAHPRARGAVELGCCRWTPPGQSSRNRAPPVRSLFLGGEGPKQCRFERISGRLSESHTCSFFLPGIETPSSFSDLAGFRLLLGKGQRPLLLHVWHYHGRDHKAAISLTLYYCIPLIHLFIRHLCIEASSLC